MRPALTALVRLVDGLAQLAHRLMGRRLPLSLLSFGVVGSLGVGVHMAVLQLSLATWSARFLPANTAAMLVATAFNYLLNNAATFRQQALRGPRWWLGFGLYLLITSLGLAANLGVAQAVHQHTHRPAASALAGIVVGALWNYLMSRTLVWRLLHRGGDAPAPSEPPRP
ncbi:hypothetical protein CCO03_02110 [Comamonas serinivorans]|uniref:GtrA/DPMS transmembrane domain-containing protein n=1 Tax=Comamonas serinivorans TaxID=1082851 RepID=A0A1Y0EJK3_9BURK|nr:GtrA family protein [Comamonas serinivorans]ARU03640.1 hypothetical protein CCO03_02110 [Comamonas serinivorans]